MAVRQDEMASEQVLASSGGGGSGGSVSVSLHPLVVMNISDHYTRTRVQESDTSVKVYGALLGRLKGRSVEVCNSFELLVTISDGRAVLDKEYFTDKEEKFKQVFSTMEFVGWYTNGDTPTPADAHFHEQICQDQDNSLMLKLNTFIPASQLPLTIHESCIEIVEGKARVLFSKVPYTLATEEAERIGVDHIARVSVSGSTQTSAVAEQLSTHHGAVKMLHSRVRLIVDYLKAIQAGQLPRDHTILREISSLCDQLPVLENKQFDGDFQDQSSEVMLMTYLAAITKGLGTASEFIAKMNVIHDRHGVARRARGLLF